MKRIIPILLAITILLSGCSSLNSDEQNNSEIQNISNEISNSISFFAMDTFMEIQAYCDEEILNDAKNIICSYEDDFSVTLEDSEIYALNRDGEGTLSGDTSELLGIALDMCERTGGALDISVYPVAKAWGFTTEDYRIPDQSEIDELVSYVEYEQIYFDGANTVVLGDNMMIDLGSVAKGYAGDKVIEMLRENGVTSGIANLGGDVHALGTKPDGSNWRVAVQDPFDLSGYVAVVEIADKAIVTSGNYERYFEYEGKRYCHIINPDTGYPSDNGLVSVSVIADNGTVADGLSTALFVMGVEEAAEFWKASDDFEAIFITEDGSIYITEGIEDSFSLYGSYASSDFTVIRRD